jgi:hypothetical protein
MGAIVLGTGNKVEQRLGEGGIELKIVAVAGDDDPLRRSSASSTESSGLAGIDHGSSRHVGRPKTTLP